MRPVLDAQLEFIVGENRPVAIKVWDENDPTTNLSAATATLAIYNQAGTATLASGACTVSGTTLITVSRNWSTAGVTPGSYRAAFTVTSGTTVQIFQVAIVVLPLPAPQTS